MPSNPALVAGLELLEPGVVTFLQWRPDATPLVMWVPEILSPYATWAYSWIRPPSRGGRRTRVPVTSASG